ncbi:nucleoside diphosphate kinase homolog 5-like [Mobula birostris]|uniref:nucleoside diphosphate kinase homolog 5-like n=1 Tax=Mobula birostris TaxID=1983395 RepID=UPI003B27F02D
MESPRPVVEFTLALIKPDAVHKELEIEETILQSGFLIVQKRRLQLSPEQASEFYAEHSCKMVFPSLTTHLCSGLLVALHLARDSAVRHWKDLLGPADPERAKEIQPRSLRAIYGTDRIRNGLHGSDCFSAAEREITFFFPNTTMEPFPGGQAAEDFLSKYITPTLILALTQLCKLKPRKPVVWLADWLLANNPNRPSVREERVREPPTCDPGQSYDNTAGIPKQH